MTITFEEAHKAFHYDPETGLITWKTASANGAYKAGARAGSRSDRYLQICYNRKRYPATHIIWLLETGKLPQNQIDHIDGDSFNDRRSNLRETTNRGNCINRSKHRNGHLPGTSNGKNGWFAQITVGKEHYHLGWFSNAQDAHQAYLRAFAIVEGGGTLKSPAKEPKPSMPKLIINRGGTGDAF